MKPLVLVALLVLLAPVAARAQVVTRVVAPDGTTGISASALVARVLESSPALVHARAVAAAHEAGIDEARVLPSPHLRGGFGVIDVSGARAPTETYVALAVPIDYAGRTGTRIDAAFAAHEAARSRIAAAEREVRAQALARFVEALAAAARLESLRGRVGLADEIAAMIERRVAVGESSAIAGALARVEAARAHAALVRAEGEARAARIAMSALVGEEELAPEGELALPPRDVELGPMLASALASRPDALAARLDVDALERARDASHRARWPELEVEVGWLHSFASLESLFNQPEFDALMLSLDVELPLRLAWDGELRRADAELEAADAAVLSAELTIRLEVGEAVARYEAARASLVALTSGPIPAASELERLARTAFERGEHDVLAVLAATEHLRELDGETIDALAEHALRLTQLLVATGSDEIPF